MTLVRQVAAESWVGWNAQARWMTASAPRNRGTRSVSATSAGAHSALVTSQSGVRRARHSSDVTAGSADRARTVLVPTFPVAPVMTIRIVVRYPLIRPSPGFGDDPAVGRDRTGVRERAADDGRGRQGGVGQRGVGQVQRDQQPVLTVGGLIDQVLVGQVDDAGTRPVQPGVTAADPDEVLVQAERRPAVLGQIGGVSGIGGPYGVVAT